MSGIVIKDFYRHENEPSVFIMFKADYEVIWCPSGNELRRLYLLDPSRYISGPTEVTVTPELHKLLMSYGEDW